jgi:hypothetical protein
LEVFGNGSVVGKSDRAGDEQFRRVVVISSTEVWWGVQTEKNLAGLAVEKNSDQIKRSLTES